MGNQVKTVDDAPVGTTFVSIFDSLLFSFPSVRMFDDVSYLLSFMDEFRRVRDKRSLLFLVHPCM